MWDFCKTQSEFQINVFLLLGRNKIQMYARSAKYKLCNFCNSEYELNALIFLKLALNNIKTNSKIHSNNIKFSFFCT